MVLMLVLVDYARPGMVHRKMIWRWQALRRVGVMLEAHQVSKAASANNRRKAAHNECDVKGAENGGGAGSGGWLAG
jgi:hypothetical protein